MVTSSLSRSFDRSKLILTKFIRYLESIYLESIYLELHLKLYIFKITTSKIKRGCVMFVYALFFYDSLKQGS